MTSAIASDAVAAGEGALSTWSTRGCSCRKSKSSTSVPSGRMAWARTPAPARTTSSTCTSGIIFCVALTKASLEKDRWTSPMEYFQYFCARRQIPGKAASWAMSLGLIWVQE